MEGRGSASSSRLELAKASDLGRDRYGLLALVTSSAAR